MRFGVVLPTYPAGATVDGVVQVAEAAERLGFDSVWTTDHVILPPEQAGPYAEILEPLLTLAYVAPLITKVRLGISVIVVPQRNVVVLAKELATLDHLCRGRLDVGVGVGWSEAEFQMLGTGDRFRHRGHYLDETLRLWRHLWTAPEQPFTGTFFDLPPAAFGPGPVQDGGPPIWVGGSSEGARRRAAAFGAAWHPVGIGPGELRELASLVRAVAEEQGRDVPELAPRIPVQIGDSGEVMAAGRMHTVAGSPQALVSQFREYAEAGVGEIVCLFNSPDGGFVVEQMELVAEHVMPHMA